ncbi:MAG: hypothetical protein OXH66_14420 [Gemmatimonadetes bacterium]|nr:hypothetical protein [Gemmatimonadota bacterium]
MPATATPHDPRPLVEEYAPGWFALNAHGVNAGDYLDVVHATLIVAERIDPKYAHRVGDVLDKAATAVRSGDSGSAVDGPARLVAERLLQGRQQGEAILARMRRNYETAYELLHGSEDR